MIHRFALASAIVCLGSASWAEPSPPSIEVVGVGMVETPPDIASLSFDVRGEGATADAATAAMVAKQQAIASALATLADVELSSRSGGLSILEVRDPACDGDDDEDRPRLSKGACAVKGYVAELGVSVRVTPPSRAGTLLALASRHGASNAELGSFQLRAPAEAQRRATAAALADAKLRAELIATASGARLGPLLNVVDSDARAGSEQEIIVTAARRGAASNDAPIEVALSPPPIETRARLVVTYGITR